MVLGVPMTFTTLHWLYLQAYGALVLGFTYALQLFLATVQGTSEAGAKGHLAALQWARQTECDWNEDTCLAAARGDRLEVGQG
jgi:hypothetical protein